MHGTIKTTPMWCVGLGYNLDVSNKKKERKKKHKNELTRKWNI